MASESELAPLQGCWRITVIEVDGRRFKRSDDGQTVTIKNDEWISSFSLPHRMNRTSTRFALDPTRHRVDFLIAPGIVSPGIYRLDGRQLEVCTNQRALMKLSGRAIEGDENAAPSSFAAPHGSGYRLWILERVD